MWLEQRYFDSKIIACVYTSHFSEGKGDPSDLAICPRSGTKSEWHRLCHKRCSLASACPSPGLDTVTSTYKMSYAVSCFLLFFFFLFCFLELGVT